MALDLDHLRQMEEPAHKVLADLVHGCSKDSATRTMAATAIVLTLQQLLSRGAACQLPSVFLVNAGKIETDPIDFVISRIAGAWKREEPEGKGMQPGGYPGTRKDASRAMLQAVTEQQKLDATARKSGIRFGTTGSWEKNYQDARAAGHGPCRISRYAEAWDERLGLITDRADAIILRLDTVEDREAFLRDLSGAPGKLLNPTGPGGPSLAQVDKTLALSGSFAAGQWDGDLVDRILALGMPVFFLPHATDAPLEVSNLQVLGITGFLFAAAGRTPVQAYPRLPGHPFVRTCEDYLWSRLPWLPRACRFAVLQAVHQLESACGEIVRHLAVVSKTKAAERSALMADLYLLALRGVTMSVAGLAWHGIGFDPGCLLPTARKLLGRIREKGQLSGRDVQRIGRFSSAEERDGVLERLRAEDLVRVDGKTVTAVPLRDFIRALDTRPGFAVPEPLWPGVVAAVRRKAS